MQNILSLDKLRDHFLKEDVSGVSGPLASSLKKLFVETKPDAGLKSVIDPRGFFESFCAKAPQFKGYNQHDSHELLRCLLDLLCTEESTLRKKCGVSDNDEKYTLIYSVFGGETSSIVTCMECGHSSKVYEPFLDLSLPVPFKRTPPGKQQTVPIDSDTSCSITAPINNGPVLENPLVTQSDTVFDSFWLDILEPETSGDETNLDMQDVGDKVLTTEANRFALGPSIPANTSFSSGDQTLEDNTERLLQDNDGFAKVETIVDEDAQATQPDECITATSSIYAEINQARCIGGDPSFGETSTYVNPWDDEEVPFSAADFQVPWYMPYKEHVSCSNDKTVAEREGEASSSFVYGDYELENNDFLDLGGLFDEPEATEGPVFGPSSKVEGSGVDFMAFSSESDPEEIDDSESPVTVERCLAHFTKPEILSEDNAWNCENCSKILKLQQLREKQKSKKDESRSSNISNGGVSENEDGVSEETLVSAMKKDSSDNFSVKDNGKEAMSSNSAYDSESEETQDENNDSEKVITVKRDATKRVLLNKAPPVLTIHLKRFSQDLRGRLSKLNGHIAFQEVIDLQQYMDSRCSREDPPVYRLAGVVAHSGTMRGGHYVAYIRGGQKVKETDSSSVWYYVSDSLVRQVSLEKVMKSEAYILFYERIFSED